jgi:hypothetical protein
MKRREIKLDLNFDSEMALKKTPAAISFLSKIL